MLRRLIFASLFLLSVTVSVSAQTAATYAARAEFGKDDRWVGRCQIASVVSAIAVLSEDPETLEHASRVAMATQVIKEPEFIARKLAAVLAAVAPVVTTAEGVTTTTLTDAELLAMVEANWTRFALALTPVATPSVAWHPEMTVPTGPLMWSGPVITPQMLDGGAR